MPETELQARIRQRLGLRVQARMGQYVARKLAVASGPLAIIGGDARTGVPRRVMVDRQLLLDDASDADAS